MQPHAPPRRRSLSGVIIILMVLGFFFFCGIMLLGVGAFVFARAETHQAQARAMVQRDLARVHVERAQAEAEAHRNHAHAERQIERLFAPDAVAVESQPAKPVEEPIRVANREITLQLDRQGKIAMDGKSLEQKQLKAALREASKGRESAIIVTIKADEKCLFERVAAVLTVCRELDIPNVRIATADPSINDLDLPAASTATK